MASITFIISGGTPEYTVSIDGYTGLPAEWLFYAPGEYTIDFDYFDECYTLLIQDSTGCVSSAYDCCPTVEWDAEFINHTCEQTWECNLDYNILEISFLTTTTTSSSTTSTTSTSSTTTSTTTIEPTTTTSSSTTSSTTTSTTTEEPTTTTTTEPPCEGYSGVLTVGDLGEGALGYLDGEVGSVSPYPIIIPEGEIAFIVYFNGGIVVGTSEDDARTVTEIIINGVSYEIIGGFSGIVDNPFVIGNSYDICINYITCPPKCDYGLLYNWYAVDTGKLAPTGWHVPTDAEWTTLTTYLGGEEVAGGKLKTTGFCDWSPPNVEATNESGFSGLPGGLRYHNGDFLDVEHYGRWWSSTEYSPYEPWFLELGFYESHSALSDDGYMVSGFSVRCLRDTYEGWENDVPVVDYDGNDYDVVEIGTQLWLVQNLKVTHYNDGESIPNVTDGTTWSNLTTGALCAYNNDWETYACVAESTTTTTTTTTP